MAGYDGHRGWIYFLAVKPDRGNAGIGILLTKHAESELKKSGCFKIHLQILEGNEAVKSFYQKNGFKVEERVSMGKEIEENLV